MLIMSADVFAGFMLGFVISSVCYAISIITLPKLFSRIMDKALKKINPADMLNSLFNDKKEE